MCTSFGCLGSKRPAVPPQRHLVQAVTETQHRKRTTSCPLGDFLLNEEKGLEIHLRFSVKVAKIIYGVLVCKCRFWNCKGCTAPLGGHITLKPTKFPEFSPDYLLEDLMFLSMVLIGALFSCLVPLTKLNESVMGSRSSSTASAPTRNCALRPANIPMEHSDASCCERKCV